jgi:ABC-type oligopeptide transport system substrate-binding subunit
MRKLVLLILMAFSLSFPLAACGDSREGMKLSKQPFDKTKCETYQNLALEAKKKNENDIIEALKNYNELCFFNMDKLKGLSKQKGMPDAR